MGRVPQTARRTVAEGTPREETGPEWKCDLLLVNFSKLLGTAEQPSNLDCEVTAL